ncbi:MAG TPA: ATP-dependent DNA ligase [Actinomycetota bacterium]
MLAIAPPVKPMLAKLESAIPSGEGWRYEPKWDGFRALVFRDGDEVRVDSRNGQPLDRYFPEMLEIAAESFPDRCVLDGEIVVPGRNGLDFDALQQRIHPAASRVKRLTDETPASFIPFDLLAEGDEDLRGRTMDERRTRLVAAITPTARCFPTPQTGDAPTAERWFRDFEGAGLDGIVAKRFDQPYVEGKRVMVKVKHERTADCVVGGYRLNKDKDGIGSLLLGAYDDEGRFHFLGFTSSFKAAERRELLGVFEPMRTGDSFDGFRMPGEPSRWSGGRDASWFPVEQRVVVEVAFDHLQGGWRFRHGTTFRRWRADKEPAECTFDQFEAPKPFRFEDIRELSG